MPAADTAGLFSALLGDAILLHSVRQNVSGDHQVDRCLGNVSVFQLQYAFNQTFLEIEERETVFWQPGQNIARQTIALVAGKHL